MSQDSFLYVVAIICAVALGIVTIASLANAVYLLAH
jgi:hypothetical protein